MRYCIAILLMAAIPAVAETPAPREQDGRALFLACEFKQAARVFEKALAEQPGSAVLSYWLGKSYARLAVISGPLSATKNAAKARRHLEKAVKLDPENKQYALELFDFYVDSPEWFGGGLPRAAALLDGFGDGESGLAEERQKELDSSRQEHSGPGWWLRKFVLRTSGATASLGFR